MELISIGQVTLMLFYEHEGTSITARMFLIVCFFVGTRGTDEPVGHLNRKKKQEKQRGETI